MRNNLDLLREQILMYLFRQSLRYEDDITELNNHTVYREADPVDHLEMIMAQTRLGTFERISADILQILRWSYDRERPQKPAPPKK